MQAADVILVVTSVIFFILMGIGAVYFLIYFQHPLDKNVAWFPKGIVVLGILVACTNILLLPLDVSTQKGDLVPTGLFPMKDLEYAFYLMTIILFFIVIPFAYMYYEGLDEDDGQGSKQLAYALKWTIPWILMMGILILVLYWFVGYAEIETVHLRSALQTAVTAPQDFCSVDTSGAPSCTSHTRWIQLRVSPVTYIIAMVNVVGWIVLIVFGGVGLAAVPFDLIQGFLHRPKRLTLQAYTKEKNLIYQRAVILKREGERIANDKANSKGKFLKFSVRRKINQATQQLKKDVLKLEIDYKKLEYANNIQGSNVLWEYTKLVFGVIGLFVTVAWVLHFILYLLPVSVGAQPVSLFLNSMFEAMQKAPFVGPLFYGLFSFYMLMAILKGNIKVGFRIVFVTLYPMELHDTLMNALLFNVGLFLTGSLAVVQLCAVAFGDYARFTANASIFLVQISNLRGIRYIFKIYVFLLLGFFVLAVLYFAMRKYKRQVKLKQPPKNAAGKV